MKKLLLTFALFLHLQCGHVTAGSAPLNQDNIAKCKDSCLPHDCSDVYAQDLTSDGVYLIYPGGLMSPPVPVYCDMTSAGGPWTVFQKRFDGSENFYRGWQDYKLGFGRASGEYWLGLQHIFFLTQTTPRRLRIDMKDFENNKRHVTYDYFSISPLSVNPEQDSYKLYVDGFKEGDPERPVGNSLQGHNGLNFSTYDRDRDMYSGNCAQNYHGAFWYGRCHGANLNGKYHHGNTTEYATGVVWYTWTTYYYSLKETEMKLGALLPVEQY
ncbi:microfibril-associated glycoprotein 4-like [Leptodactylus fuscus]|uniref:microfibril-associated glycoprotein 4-like n=1 Tax=Leptodactylus fuscus TaxID=238119 RepID=UPI003F4EF565